MLRSPEGGKIRAGHHRRLNKEIHDDLQMFQEFLSEYADRSVSTIPFLNKTQIFSNDLGLFADSSGAPNLGFGCFFQGDWRAGKWSDTQLFKDNFRPNIALLEFFAIITALYVWAEQLAGKYVVLRSDNTATVAFINRMKADIPAAMDLLRKLTKTCLHFQIFVKAQHIDWILNCESDWLSRGMMSKFFQRHPQVPKTHPPLLSNLWPLQWTKQQMQCFERKGKPPQNQCK